MDAKHTPGPWSERGQDGFFDDHSWNADNNEAGRTSFLAVHANGTVIALVVRTDWDDAKLEADARLIAAAPELLAELSKRVGNAEEAAFDEWLQGTTPSGDVTAVKRQWEESREYRAFCEDWQSAFDVIAKATGE